jgi:zinc transport system permease protein
MIELLGYEFFQNALCVGLLASTVSGIVGTYIVVKKLSFVSGSIAHSAFGGIGLAFYLGIDPLMGALGFVTGASAMIGAIRNRWPEHEDALIGGLWSVGMALGILFIHLSNSYSNELFSYLFGNILLATQTDLWMLSILNVVIIGFVMAVYKPLLSITFDEEYSIVSDLPTKWLYIALFMMIGLTTVVLVKAVGIILVITLLTLPAATALNVSQAFLKVQGLAVLASVIATIGGLFMSYALDFPSGPCIILVSVVLYALSLLKNR